MNGVVLLEIAIIADDLTGANDSGVQLAKRGFRAAVMMGAHESAVASEQVVVFDTDSRRLSKEEAYRSVRETAEWIKKQPCRLIFKKIDSTMRGNIGAEIDAVYDTFLPDFVIIAPAFPLNKRQVADGYLYVNGKLLQETEVALDPITPVRESFLPKLLGEQTSRPIALITHRDLAGGQAGLIERLKKLKEEGAAYIVFDALEDEHLQEIVEIVQKVSSNIVWVGSAGLAGYLPIPAEEAKEQGRAAIHIRRPALMVVGSVSRTARSQLNEALSAENVKGVNMQSVLVAAGEPQRGLEIERVYSEAQQAILGGAHVILYCTGEPEDVEEIAKLGIELNLSPSELGLRIASALGEAASRLVYSLELDGVILTGGDTAKQFCRQARIQEFILMDEVEAGIPIGRLKGDTTLYAVTKAGSFGSNAALVKALHYLQGGESI
jgi:D-threonate/D-erythronate kinase